MPIQVMGKFYGKKCMLMGPIKSSLSLNQQQPQNLDASTPPLLISFSLT